MRGRIAVTAGVLLASAHCSSSTAPHGYDPLPQTTETVLAALDLFTTGTVQVPVSCSSSPTIDCPGGSPGGPVYLGLTRADVAITDSVTVRTFYYSVKLKAVSLADLPLSVPVAGNCTVRIDTSPGADSVVQVSGSASFGSQTPGGPIDRLDLTQPTLTGLSAEDVSISGGIGCDIATIGLGFFDYLIENTLVPPAWHLCGAPGTALFEPCQVATAAARASASRVADGTARTTPAIPIAGH